MSNYDKYLTHFSAGVSAIIAFVLLVLLFDLGLLVDLIGAAAVYVIVNQAHKRMLEASAAAHPHDRAVRADDDQAVL